MSPEEAIRMCSEAAGLIAVQDPSPEDCIKAYSMFKQAADAGFPEGYFGLAEMTVSGLGTEADIDRAVELYVKASELGSIPADFRLGIIFANVPDLADYGRQMAYFEKCQKAGFSPVYEQLGDLYMFGLGIEKDEDKALDFFIRSADTVDSPSAKLKAGYILSRKGETGRQGEYFLKSAEAGIPEAMFEVASMIVQGTLPGTKSDAVGWYSKCAEALPTAKYNLACMVMAGDGTPKDEEKAFGMFLELADGGDPDAMFQVGRMCYMGTGTPKDRDRAYRYFQEASSHGHNEAAIAADAIFRSMNGQIIDIADPEKKR